MRPFLFPKKILRLVHFDESVQNDLFIHNKFFREHFVKKVRLDKNELSGHTKMREHHEMSKEMYKIHDHINRCIRDRLQEILPSRISRPSKYSAVRAIWSHRTWQKGFGRCLPRFYYCPDLKSAFPSLKAGKLAKVLEKYFGDKNLEDKLRLLCCRPSGGLIVGAAASNILFYLYCRELIDDPLADFCEEHGIKCTRYVDDFLLSWRHDFREEEIRHVRKGVLKILRAPGFRINQQKTRMYDITKGTFNVNGVVFKKRKGDGGTTIGISLEYRETLEALLHKAWNTDEVSKSVLAGKMNIFMEIARVKGYEELTTKEARVLARYHYVKEKFQGKWDGVKIGRPVF